MIDVISQPNASPLPDHLIASLLNTLPAAGGALSITGIDFRNEHSNDLAELRFADGRTLIVKRGRYEWMWARFETSRLASGLVREEAGVLAPAPLDFPADLNDQPLELYWRIDLPTLQTVWSTVPADAKPDVLRSWGELIRRVHDIEMPGYGALPERACENRTLAEFLASDLGERLFPAVAGEWPSGLWLLEELRELVPIVVERLSSRNSALVHNDLHMGNVLCEVGEDGVRCVGLLDLEAAFAGPPEADLASLEVHHGPLFCQPLAGAWWEHVWDGYGAGLDPWTVAFFRAYHLLNMGFYSAFIGHDWHAEQVLRALRREVTAISASRSLRTARTAISA